MDSIRLLDISAVLGLCAMVVLTINILLGMLLSTGYKAAAAWKKLPLAVKRINLRWLHNLTAYVALVLVILHPFFLVLDPGAHFSVRDIFLPFYAPSQQVFVAMGTVSVLALITVVVTTQKIIKKRMSFRRWKNIHLVSYGTALLFIIHALKMDPDFKDRATDWLDGEKLLGVFCGLILAAAVVVRVRRLRRQRAALKQGPGSSGQ